MKNLSIRIKNLLWILSLSFLPLLISIVLIVHHAKTAFIDSLREKMTLLTHVTGKSIELHIDSTFPRSFNNLRKKIININQDWGRLQKIVNNSTYFRSFIWIKVNGDTNRVIFVKAKGTYKNNIYFSPGDYTDSLKTILNGKNGFRFISLKDKNGKNREAYLRFIRKFKLGKNKELYKMVVFYKMKTIFEKKLPINNYKTPYSFFFFTNKGELFYNYLDSVTAKRPVSDLVRAINKRMFLPNGKLSDPETIPFVLETSSGDKYFSVCRDFGHYKFRIVILTPHEVAFKKINNFFYLIGIAILGALILILLINYFSLNKLLSSFKRFRWAAEEVAKGNYDLSLSVSGSKEIEHYADIFNKMIQEVRVKSYFNIDRIIAEKAKLDQILNGISDGVIVINENKEVILVNIRFCQWFGLTRDILLNRKIKSFDKLREFDKIADDLLYSDKNNSDVKEFNVFENGKEIFLHLVANKIRTKNGKFIGISFLLRDYTKNKEIEKLKSETFSFVAHEMRSPLTSIIGFSEFLVEGGFSPEEQAEFQKIILSEGKRMLNFINDFLDITKLEQGQLNMKMSTVDIRKIIEKEIEKFKYQIGEKSLILETDFPEQTVSVFTYPQLIAMICNNYISNAIKYSPTGKKITVRLKTDEKYYYIEVEDEGYGIPEEEHKKVFEKFFRSNKNTEIKGTGLGLSLVKKAANQLGGEVYFSSSPGKGSLFGVKLPL